MGVTDSGPGSGGARTGWPLDGVVMCEPVCPLVRAGFAEALAPGACRRVCRLVPSCEPGVAVPGLRERRVAAAAQRTRPRVPQGDRGDESRSLDI